MLKDDLYHIISFTHKEGALTAGLELNAGHPLFQGHFPGQPVVPGACLLQMVKELLMTAVETGLTLSKASNLKFLSPADPSQNATLNVSLTYLQDNGLLKTTATITSGENSCLKFQGEFKMS